jgi:GT2 family glycosyltransferase
MILDLALALLAVPVLLASGYLLVLALLSRRPAPAPRPPRRVRFDVVVPAHDEEHGIVRTVRSLFALDWPRDRLRVMVVADNCSDRTAERAAAAGAEVLVRRDPARRGKGYALQHAFRAVLERGATDAVVVVDADAEVSPDLLSAFAARLERGAMAVQASSGVLNPDDSWRTRLMAIALTLVGDVRSLGRERLRLSCGLRGIGMCLSVEALRRVPYAAFSLVEDAEYCVSLARAGIRVHFAWDGRVTSEISPAEEAARTQRLRWEDGRRALQRAEGPSLLREALRRRDRVLLELAIDLLVPPLARVSAYAAAGTAAAAALAATSLASAFAVLPWLLSAACLGVYVLRGVQLSGLGVRGLVALAWAPLFMAWKVTLLPHRASHATRGWVRTARMDANRPLAPSPELELEDGEEAYREVSRGRSSSL